MRRMKIWASVAMATAAAAVWLAFQGSSSAASIERGVSATRPEWSISPVALEGKSRPAPRRGCTVGTATPAYVDAVTRAVLAKRDVWGERLLDAPDGPTYPAARRFLAPILYGQQRQYRPLTSSGVYYLPLSFPYTAYGSTAFALHVADGSEIVTRHVGGPGLSL